MRRRHTYLATVAAIAVLSSLAGAASAAAEPAIALAAPTGTIAFTSTRDGNDEIYVMRADGSAQNRLTTNAAPDQFPAWSPDGEKLAFTRGSDIYVMNADGTEQTRLTNTPGYINTHPTWSPDGQKIAFTSDRDGWNYEIYVMNADGSGQTRLTDNPALENTPSWSPDGQKIAFVSSRDWSGEGSIVVQIYVMNADGSGQTRLTQSTDFSDFNPTWSPDGQAIAFARRTLVGALFNFDIYVMNAADGSGQIRLTDHAAVDVMPAWSPDGQHLAFTSERDGNREIYVMNAADGSEQTRLTNNPALEQSPAWQPAPDPPIVFLHGFLGSRIACGSEELWPDLPFPRFLDMELSADGITNRADDACNASAAVDGILETAAGSDVYESTVDFLEEIAPGRNYVFDWDWRTTPAVSLHELDAFVEEVSALHDGQDVVLMAHSMGGLLARLYIDDPERAEKVARVLTIGTPYWGSPKSVFPLAIGQETPGPSALDALMENDELMEFAKNLFGLYFLYPSSNYGGWLAAPDSTSPLDQSELVTYISQALGGNGQLLELALAAHASLLDGFETNGVDYRVVVGTGFNTISKVAFERAIEPGGDDLVRIEYANGDQTVPGRSAAQGILGTSDPLGEDVPLHYACGVGHVALPGHPQVTDEIRGFLLSGDEIEGLDNPCPADGFELSAYPLDDALPFHTSIGQSASSAGSSAQAAPLSLTDAELQGLIQLIELEGQTLVVTDAGAPVDLAFPSGEFRLEVTPLTDGERGETLIYGPLSGDVTVSAGDGVEVFEDGQPVEPGGDAVPPVVTCDAPAPIFLLGQSPAIVTASVLDAGSGVVSPSVSTAADTSSVGAKSVALTGEDLAGNTATVNCSYGVRYGFQGFFAPVDNGAVLNVVKAGQAIPLKWRLTDATGAPVLNLATPAITVQSLDCSSGATDDLVEEIAAGASGLQNLGGGYYQLNWKSPASYAGSCTTIRLDLGEGLYRTALFRFRA